MSILKSSDRVKMRQQTLLLTSQLSRWCGVREDLLFAFEKCLDAGLEEPIRQKVNGLVARVRGGMAVDKALDLMLSDCPHEHFRDLISAVRFNFRYRGDLPGLLEQIELQLHRIEAEYDRRRLSNARDLFLTLAILLAAPLLVAFRMFVDLEIRQAFFETEAGRILILISVLFYGSGLAWFVVIRRRIHG